MSQEMNTSSAALEYIVGTFDPTEKPWEFLCREPKPRGSWVFVNGIEMADGQWPKCSRWYIVAITRSTKSGRARRGHIVASVEIICQQLIEELQKATWELNRHGRYQVQGRYITTCYGKFEPIYDSGSRSNGQDESPSIHFLPFEDLMWGEILHEWECCQRLFCLDERELERAKNAKRPESVQAAPDLGELLAAKMAGENKN